jgi:cysteinyl-tRNA synthetase
MIQITNTLKTGETKLPEVGAKIRMFVCGPTVYDYIHIGNARTFVVFDVIAKYLRYRGYKLKYIQNITDIDDRIIARAKETGVEPKELARKFERIFLDNMKELKVDSVDKYPRATDHIPEIIKQVKTLIEKGNAYLIEGDGYYFDLKTFPEYGKLSGRTAEMAEDAVSRIDESSGKRNKGDFCLWKLAQHRSEAFGAGFSKEGEPSWPADIGEGRPGWHIEDTAITEKYFGPQYEIHGGGQDLIFPHHEAEIAQQESASGLKPFVRFWLHAGFLINKGGKMSKSLGNFLTVEEALKKYSPEALRFYFLSAHYRSPLDYGEDSIKTAEAAYQRIREFRNKLALKTDQTLSESKTIEDAAKEAKKSFEIAMNNDFNTPNALAALFDFMGIFNKTFAGKIGGEDMLAAVNVLQIYNKVFGIVPEDTNYYDEIEEMVSQREEAREQKDFKKADELREQIKNLGYEVEDTVYGPLVKKID